jgi:glycosyltransferase involved in cell wall biosynthesis
VPVIISPGCYLPEVAMYGAGRVVEPQREPLQAALENLISRPKQRQIMGACGQSLIRDLFTWDAVALKLESLYDSLLAVTASNA